MSAFEAGTWVWMPDDEHVIIPAKVKNTFAPGAPGAVVDELGEGEISSVARSQPSAPFSHFTAINPV